MVEKIDPSDPEARRISWQDRLPEEVVVEPEIDHSSVNVINQRIKSRCWEELTGSCGLCIDPSAGEVSQKLVEACRDPLKLLMERGLTVAERPDIQ